jgi:hypothetical protein
MTPVTERTHMKHEWSIANVVAEPDRLLASTENPRHRAMLANFRQHALLEIAGRWREILVPAMLVDRPVYRINEGRDAFVLDGMPAVAEFYEEMASAGLTVFAPVTEQIAVADWGLAIESHFLHHLPGRALLQKGIEIDDPDASYQLTHYMASFWPYDDDVRLIGEHIYEDATSRVITKLDPATVVTPAMAAETANELLRA